MVRKSASTIKKNMKYILDQKRDTQLHNATGKAMTDVFTVMDRCGVKVVPGIPKNKSKLLRVLDYPILVAFCLVKVCRADSVIYVYKENALKIRIVNALRKIRRYNTVCLINDVNSVREGVTEKIDEEFELIGGADTILAPNEGSIEYMRKRGMNNKMIPVKVWDYLMDESGEDVVKFNEKGVLHVAFAGNLGKSLFIRELGDKPIASDKVVYHLWGDIEDEHIFDEFDNVIYEGSVSARELIGEIRKKCDVGLVWDGERASTIAGVYGEYLRINNSHKCGCYLAAGLPVIVWSKSGAAYFVRESGCGWCIDSLEDIECIACNMDKTVFEATKEVSAGVREGRYLTEAVLSITV